GARGRGRAGHRDRVEGVPQPRLRLHPQGAEDAGDLRWPQPVRAAPRPRQRSRLPADRPALTGPARIRVMKILITGAAGFIGMHVAQRLLARGDTVVGIDNLNAYY